MTLPPWLPDCWTETQEGGAFFYCPYIPEMFKMKTTPIDWTSAIESDLEDESLPPKRKIHYTMPRQIGVTTFLIKLASRLQESGKKVIFIVPKQAWVKEYAEKMGEGIVVASAANIWRLKGWRYDILVGDCLKKEIDDVEREAEYNVTGPRLYIDSGY